MHVVSSRRDLHCSVAVIARRRRLVRHRPIRTLSPQIFERDHDTHVATPMSIAFVPF